jgi:hypothetical protein
LRKNAGEHAMGASVVVVAVAATAAGWVGGAERVPTLPEDGRAENAKRSGWKASSVGRCD